MADGQVVFVYDHFYPDYSAGGPVTSLGNLALLLKNSMEVRILSSSKEFRSGIQMQGIKSNTWSSWNNMLVYYADSNTGIVNAFRDFSNETILFLNGVFSLNYFLFVLIQARRRKIKVIVSPRGMLQKGALQSGYLKKWFYLNLLRISGMFNDLHWHATDTQELADIKKWMGADAVVTVVSNIPRQYTNIDFSLSKKPGELRLVYFSLISEKKNLLFLLEVLDHASMEGISLDIVGPIKDQNYWEACQRKMKMMIAPDQIVYRGECDPMDIQECLTRYHAMTLSTHGENFGHSIIESLSCGRPVLISDLTPWGDVASFGAGYAEPLEVRLWRLKLHTMRGWDQLQFIEAGKSSLKYVELKLDIEGLQHKYTQLFERRS